jgi:hypothetical protein
MTDDHQEEILYYLEKLSEAQANQSEPKECSVCNEDCKEYVFLCDHANHKDCVKRWLTENPTRKSCFTCRAPMKTSVYEKIKPDYQLKTAVIDNEAKVAFRRLGYFECPNCNIWIERTGGCNRIQCTQCYWNFTAPGIDRETVYVGVFLLLLLTLIALVLGSAVIVQQFIHEPHDYAKCNGRDAYMDYSFVEYTAVTKEMTALISRDNKIYKKFKKLIMEDYESYLKHTEFLNNLVSEYELSKSALAAIKEKHKTVWNFNSNLYDFSYCIRYTKPGNDL